MQLPRLIRVLAKLGQVEQALELVRLRSKRTQSDSATQNHELTETENERIAVYKHAGRYDDAAQLAREHLFAQSVDEIVVEGDWATVYCGPFSGTHTIRHDRHGDARACTEGSYIHEPTDVEFVSECPDELQLQDEVRAAATGPSPGDAARAAYRTSRL